MNPRRWKYGYAWDNPGVFVFSIAGHWVFGWFSFTSEQLARNQPIQVSDYVTQMLRDTFENWQSEFLQLRWQVGGLAILLHLGSPQSKEGSDLVEDKIDAILRKIDPERGEQIIAELDEKFAQQPDEPPRQRFARKNA
ncbi:MAG: DUF6766 family protein [Alphaproteobacteria bacterium]